jgi:hypothetical protein
MHNLHILTSNYTIRESMHMGKKHLILPVIMLTEGVHAGSHGPLLHLADEMGRFPGAWDGIPISVQHPVMDGYNVSCNAPDVIDEQAVGRVYHTQMDGGRLRAEAWIDLEAITRISPEALRYIQQGHPLDVSVGVFTDDEQVTGDWNGKSYHGIARNHRPDHLALLPGGVGACDWAAGCGVRTNEKGGVMADISEAKVSLEDVFKCLQPGDYRLKDDGSVEPIVTKTKEVATMAETTKDKPCCPEKVELLIQDSGNKWAEGDREMLLTMSAEQIEKLAPVEVKVEVPATPPAMNQEQAIQVLKDQFSDPDKALALFPQEIQENLRHGLNLYRAQRAEMIKKITTNTDVYTAEELAPLSMEALDKLARAILPKTDFTPLGGGNGNPVAYEGEALLPPGVE